MIHIVVLLLWLQILLRVLYAKQSLKNQVLNPENILCVN